MGSGFHGGFGETYGKRENRSAERNSPMVSLPNGAAQIRHIFADRKGHLPDTPENRELLLDLAGDRSKFIGKDRFGNSWHAEMMADGTQNWVRHKDGVINNGGRNETPMEWDKDTGLNKNPVLRRKKGKK